MIAAHFINGLASFSLCLAITIETRCRDRHPVLQGLWLLSCFALIRSLGNWMITFSSLWTGFEPDLLTAWLPAVQMLLIPVASVFLMLFAISIIRTARPRQAWLYFSIPLLVTMWSVAAFRAWDGVVPATPDFLAEAEAWARYLLYLPGLALCVVGSLVCAGAFQRAALTSLACDCRSIAAAFGLKALFAGMIVPASDFFPASVLNEALFSSNLGVPVQVFRAVMTAVTTLFFVRVLKASAAELDAEFQRAIRARLEDHQRALEAQLQAHENLERWAAWLKNAVDTLGTVVSKTVSPGEVMEPILHRVLELTEFEAGAMYLLDEEHSELELVCQHGLSEVFAAGVQRLAFSEGVVGRTAAARGPVVLSGSPADETPVEGLVQQEGFRIRIGLPLRTRDSFLGVMVLASRNHRSFSEEEVTVLSAVGQQIGVAIDNARLYEQVKQISILEERDRLARELHDQLAQRLAQLNMKAAMTLHLFSEADAEQVQTSLEDLGQLTRAAYTDLREAIFNLRMAGSPGSGLLPSLRRYVDEYRLHYGVTAQLVGVNPGVESCMAFSPAGCAEVLRIIQEALTNVRKHADCESVTISFARVEDRARIVVEDQGRGFHPMQLAIEGRPTFGLEIMDERAASIGGTLEIDSQPGRGTRVIISVPCTAAQRGGTCSQCAFC